MTCRNPQCRGGFVPVVILLDTWEEIRLFAEHLPNAKPHIQHAKVPCPNCCGQRLHQIAVDRLNPANARL